MSFEVWGVSDENSSTLKRLKLGMVSSFHPHNMCKNVERVTANTGRISRTKLSISFEVWGFQTKTHLLWKGSNLRWCHHFTHVVCAQNLTGLRQILNALHVQIGPSPSKYEGFRTKIHLLWKGWHLAWYHHLTHIACVQNLRGLRTKLGALCVQTGPSPSKYEGFRMNTHLLWKGWN